MKMNDISHPVVEGLIETKIIDENPDADIVSRGSLSADVWKDFVGKGLDGTIGTSDDLLATKALQNDFSSVFRSAIITLKI